VIADPPIGGVSGAGVDVTGPWAKDGLTTIKYKPLAIRRVMIMSFSLNSILRAFVFMFHPNQLYSNSKFFGTTNQMSQGLLGFCFL
jgi:hypothetical protein